MELIERETFHVCGYAVETTAADNDADVSALYKDFFDTGKEAVLLGLAGSKKGYYGLSWYTQGHDKYCYLLGIEVGRGIDAPSGALLKDLDKTQFAVARYSHDKDIMEAWTEFFFTDIPNQGFAPNAEYNLYFEYYPDDVHGDYELWVPVVKATTSPIQSTIAVNPSGSSGSSESL